MHLTDHLQRLHLLNLLILIFSFNIINAWDPKEEDLGYELNHKYLKRLWVYNGSGYSAFTNNLVFDHSAEYLAPEAPTSLRVTDYDYNRIDLEWNDNSDDENGFQLQRADSTLEFETIEFLDANITSYSDDFNLQPGKNYYYRLRAFNDMGYSDFTDTVHVLLPPIPEIIIPILTINRTTHNSIELSWELSENNQVTYSLYRILPEIDTIVLENLTTNLYLDEGLRANTLYKYWIQARDSHGGVANSNICEATTLPNYMQNRTSDNLITLYIFGQRKNDSIMDQAWYNIPTNLYVSDTSNLKNDNTGYIEINTNNLLISNRSTKISEACKLNQEITIECWLKTSNAISSASSRILSLEDEESIAFSLSCMKETNNSNSIRYFINLTTSTTDQFGNPDFTIEEPVDVSVLQHVVFTHNNIGEEAIYVNNKLAATGYRPPNFEVWGNQYNLVVANNLIEDSPWLGNLYLCAIYNKSLEPDDIAMNYYASPFLSDSCILNPDYYEIYIYPNPVNDILQVTINHPNANVETTQVYKLSIFNQQGVLLHEENVSEILENGILSLDISLFTGGIYSLILSNPNNYIDQKKFIIVR